MVNIKIVVPRSFWPVLRQTPQSNGVWKHCKFYFDRTDVEKFDYCVVFFNLIEDLNVVCPPENTIFVTAEPESLRKYHQSFLDQFGIIISSQPNLKHPNVIRKQLLPWLVGGKLIKVGEPWVVDSKDYDELSELDYLDKNKEISLIASDKKLSSGHKLRFDFIRKVKKYFGKRIEVFGIGIYPISDKWDALSPYKYSIVIENTRQKDYWSEKLMDSFLAYTYPIYYGCPNIMDFFPEDSISIIDINDPIESIKIIESVLDADPYEQSLTSLKLARNLVLNDYNIFNVLSEICTSNLATDDSVVLKSYDHFETKSKWQKLLTRFWS